MDGFLEAVTEAWDCALPNVDNCILLDHKLRRTAKALQSWSMRTIGSVRSQLFMARELIAQFDKAQESRQLTDSEHNLHRQLKLISLGLASLARSIERQRSRIRFLKEGDAYTKFFHLQACHRSRKNIIPTFEHQGTWVSEKRAKSDAIFQYFNDILGKPFQRQHFIVLHDLLPQVDLSGIDNCFSEQEVWEAVKDLPGDRAPGPDGFNGDFYKAAWPVIKADVLNALNAVWSLDGQSLYLLNDALMILLRKHNAPSTLKDYRPIALVHSFGKLLTKCLARRFAPRLSEMVAQSQSAFIKGRLIHDNFRTVQLACKWLHANKSPSLLLKIDIAKAFDSVSWAFLLEVLQRIGFSRRWMDWIALILSTASTRVLVNGRPSRRIAHIRELRQGDPISPMLFILVMEVLSSLIREADRRLVLTARAALYADDLVVLLAPTEHDLSCLAAILDLFAGASGLMVNQNKCTATPIQCDEDAVAAVLQTFPCPIKEFPASTWAPRSR